VRHLYDLVTFEAGTTPDWNVVRALFIDEAVVVLRTSRDSSSVFSVDGFVQDFISFIERANVEQTGFVEHIVRMKTMVFKDIAHVLVLYEASIPGSPRPPQQGIDSFQLIRQGGRWLIASVMNDIPDPDHPVPTELEDLDVLSASSGRACEYATLWKCAHDDEILGGLGDRGVSHEPSYEPVDRCHNTRGRVQPVSAGRDGW
jgi:hypothetical protein